MADLWTPVVAFVEAPMGWLALIALGLVAGLAWAWVLVLALPYRPDTPSGLTDEQERRIDEAVNRRWSDPAAKGIRRTK